MRRGEVYWVRFEGMGATSSGVIRKPRPAVIVTNDAAIPHLNRLQVVPFTSNVARQYPGEAIVTARGRQSKALATQITTVDASDVRGYIDTLSDAHLAAVDQAIRQQLGL